MPNEPVVPTNVDQTANSRLLGVLGCLAISLFFCLATFIGIIIYLLASMGDK